MPIHKKPSTCKNSYFTNSGEKNNLPVRPFKFLIIHQKLDFYRFLISILPNIEDCCITIDDKAFDSCHLLSQFSTMISLPFSIKPTKIQFIYFFCLCCAFCCLSGGIRGSHPVWQRATDH